MFVFFWAFDSVLSIYKFFRYVFCVLDIRERKFGFWFSFSFWFWVVLLVFGSLKYLFQFLLFFFYNLCVLDSWERKFKFWCDIWILYCGFVGLQTLKMFCCVYYVIDIKVLWIMAWLFFFFFFLFWIVLLMDFESLMCFVSYLFFTFFDL